MPRAYAQDLAYIHDVGFGDFAREAAPGLLEILRRHGVTLGLVVDLGCGSGIWGERLVQAGYDVLGIDQSAAMLTLAREKAPRATFRRTSLWSVKLPRCDAVTALGECFNYRFGPKAGPARLESLFSRIHAALRPGGVLIFDIAEPGRGAGPSEREWRGEDWALRVTVEEDARRRELTRRITAFRRVGKLYRRSEETHRLRLVNPSDVAAALRRAGFRVRVVRGYGELRFKPGLAALVARKP